MLGIEHPSSVETLVSGVEFSPLVIACSFLFVRKMIHLMQLQQGSSLVESLPSEEELQLRWSRLSSEESCCCWLKEFLKSSWPSRWDSSTWWCRRCSVNSWHACMQWPTREARTHGKLSIAKRRSKIFKMLPRVIPCLTPLLEGPNHSASELGLNSPTESSSMQTSTINYFRNIYKICRLNGIKSLELKHRKREK